MKRKLNAKKFDTRIKSALRSIKTIQTEVQKLVKDRGLMREAKRMRGVLEREAKKHLNHEARRVKGFLDLARRELEAIQKRYLGRPKKKKSKVDVHH